MNRLTPPAFENFGPPGVLGERGRTRYRKLASSLQMVQAFAKIIETAELEERVFRNVAVLFSKRSAEVGNTKLEMPASLRSTADSTR